MKTTYVSYQRTLRTQKHPTKSDRVQKARILWLWLKLLNHWKSNYTKVCQFKGLGAMLTLFIITSETPNYFPASLV